MGKATVASPPYSAVGITLTLPVGCRPGAPAGSPKLASRAMAESEAMGLSVPGMPASAPGTDVPGRKDPHEVLLVDTSGQSSVFVRHLKWEPRVDATRTDTEDLTIGRFASTRRRAASTSGAIDSPRWPIDGRETGSTADDGSCPGCQIPLVAVLVS